MNGATLNAHKGEIAILKMNGEYLSGTWEVKLLKVVNGKALVEWKKPAMKAGERNGKKWDAKPADKTPKQHTVPLAALTLKTSPSKAKHTKAIAELEKVAKVAQKKPKEKKRHNDIASIYYRLMLEGLDPVQAVVALKAAGALDVDE